VYDTLEGSLEGMQKTLVYMGVREGVVAKRQIACWCPACMLASAPDEGLTRGLKADRPRSSSPSRSAPPSTSSRSTSKRLVAERAGVARHGYARSAQTPIFARPARRQTQCCDGGDAGCFGAGRIRIRPRRA